MNSYTVHPSSYRDAAGFIFEYEGKIYRQVNKVYSDNYTLLHSSGLYTALVKSGKLITHEAIQENITCSNDWYITLLPQQLAFISYPYEWCFDELKDAALLTLNILRTSLDHGMILKDASPFNIQFADGKPVFIDTLSFEKYDTTKPWIAYRQFVECFVVPLVLSSYTSTDFIKQLQLNPDGISTAFAAKVLPFTCRFRLSLLLHIYLPNAVKGSQQSKPAVNTSFSKQKLINIISSFTSLIHSLKPAKAQSAWRNYYEETILSNTYLEEKLLLVKNWIKEVDADTAIDIGTNTGIFAIAAAERFKQVIAIDNDDRCVNDLYLKCKAETIKNILPLCVDIANPTPAIGWANKEREAFLSRPGADLIIALAVIHHLIIGRNISMPQVAALFRQMGKYIIVEFVPKSDSKVLEMIKNREDIFYDYNEEGFERSFEVYFNIIRKQKINGTDRVLFLMKKR
ncbi:MAG: SAM-dependent methyltransferase [Chitinophagaceae bacterium]|nr:SAM-dependent methyltransferase [Chitinophagaceae bacterium]